MTTNYINRDEATFQASRIVNRKQTPCVVTTVTWPQSNMNSHCHVAEAKEASFVAKKKTNVFIHAKCPSQAITHASTTECSFVSLILSYFQPNPVIHGPKLQILTWTQYIPYVTVRPRSLFQWIVDCIADIELWCRSHGLKLNADKSDVI